MRVAKVEGVYFDRKRGRAIIERRVPREVHAKIGGPLKRRHKFPRSVDYEMAKLLAGDIIRGWEREWNRVLNPGVPWFDPAAIIAQNEAMRSAAVKFQALVDAGTITMPTREEVREMKRRVDDELGIKAADLVYTSADALADWVEHRRIKYKKPTSQKALAGAKSKLARLVAFLGHDNLALVTDADLSRYETALMGDVGAGGWRDHAMMLKAIFRIAHAKNRITANAAAGLTYEKNTGRRDRFSRGQNAVILRAAMMHPDPVIRITTLICGFSGLRPAEIVEASVADFVERDGQLVFSIQTGNRKGDEKTVKTPQSERFITVHSAIRGVVEQHLRDRRARDGDNADLFEALRHHHGRRADHATAKLGRWLRAIPGLELAANQTFYSFRHTACSELASARVPEALADFITGHSPANLKRRVYHHWPVADVRDAIETLPNPFAQAGA